MNAYNKKITKTDFTREDTTKYPQNFQKCMPSSLDT